MNIPKLRKVAECLLQQVDLNKYNIDSVRIPKGSILIKTGKYTYTLHKKNVNKLYDNNSYFKVIRDIHLPNITLIYNIIITLAHKCQELELENAINKHQLICYYLLKSKGYIRFPEQTAVPFICLCETFGILEQTSMRVVKYTQDLMKLREKPMNLQFDIRCFVYPHKNYSQNNQKQFYYC